MPRPSHLGFEEEAATPASGDVEQEPLLEGDKDQEEQEVEVRERGEVQEEKAISFLKALRIPGVVEFSLRWSRN